MIASRLRWRICRLCRNKNPVTKAEWNQVSELSGVWKVRKKWPAFLRTTDSVEREFSVPEEYLEKQEKFEQKKAEMLSKWNENFLSQDMSSYHAKYEEANKKVFFLKGKAQAALDGRNAAVCRISGGGRPDSAVSDGDHCLSAGKSIKWKRQKQNCLMTGNRS